MVRTIKAGDQFPFSKGIITIKKVTKYRVRIGYSYFDTDEIITDLYEMTIEDFNNSKFAEIIDKGVYSMSTLYSFIKKVCDNVLSSVIDLDYSIDVYNLIHVTREELDKIADYISHAIGDYTVGIDKTGGDGIATIDIYQNDNDGNYYQIYQMEFRLMEDE